MFAQGLMFMTVYVRACMGERVREKKGDAVRVCVYMYTLTRLSGHI